MDSRSLNPVPTWMCWISARFCNTTCDVAVWASPPRYGVVEVLWGGPVFRCGVTVVGMLCQNPYCARVEVPCREGADEGGKVGPAHREVAGEVLVETLVELSLNESNKSGQHVLLHRYLCS